MVRATFALLPICATVLNGCQVFGGIEAFDVTTDPSEGRGCTSPALHVSFCADFDDREAWPPEGSLIPPTAGGATIALDNSISFSGTGSMRAAVPSLDQSGSAYAGLNVNFDDVSVTEAVTQFQYFATANTVDNIVEFSWATDPPQALPYFAAVTLRDGTAELVEQVPGPDGVTYPQPASHVVEATGKWVKIGLKIKFATSGATSAEIDVGDVHWTRELNAPRYTAPLTFAVGGVYVLESPKGWTANFDDVQVNIR